MNFKDRDGLNLIISEVIENKIDTIFVENKDRLARFGFELLEKMFESFGTKIVVISNAENTTYEQELTQDLISIIHHFSMKSYSNRRKLNKIKTNPNKIYLKGGNFYSFNFKYNIKTKNNANTTLNLLSPCLAKIFQ